MPGCGKVTAGALDDQTRIPLSASIRAIPNKTMQLRDRQRLLAATPTAHNLFMDRSPFLLRFGVHVRPGHCFTQHAIFSGSETRAAQNRIAEKPEVEAAAMNASAAIGTDVRS